jgi:hypothetical protein
MTTASAPLTPGEHSILVAKVERLWRKARSTTFPAEARALEEKAMYLMARARITDAMLDLGGDPDRIIDDRIGDLLRGGYRVPSEAIFNEVCKAFGCRAYLYLRGRTSQPAAVGFGSDIDRVRFLWPLLHGDALRAASELRGRTPAQTSALRRSSMYGYAEAIAERFEAINGAAFDDADRGVDQSGVDGPLALDGPLRGADGPVGTALVVTGRMEQVNGYFDEMRISGRSRRVSAGSGGHAHGRAAGMAADLTGGSTTLRSGRRELAG